MIYNLNIVSVLEIVCSTESKITKSYFYLKVRPTYCHSTRYSRYPSPLTEDFSEILSVASLWSCDSDTFSQHELITPTHCTDVVRANCPSSIFLNKHKHDHDRA